jgi:cytochrome c biogenesis protein ResB
VWLLAGLAVWSALGTAGVEGAFSSPVFYAAAALLFVSTILCAWERTLWAAEQYRHRGQVSRSLVRRLAERPHATLPLGGVGEPDASAGWLSPLEKAGEALSALRLDVRGGPRMVEGVGGRWGLIGSPVFHWSLALLIAVVALGQLTRAEGQMGIPVGSSRVDVAESYGFVDEGPWYGEHSGLTIAVTELRESYVVDEIDRGPAPLVQLYDENRLLQEDYLYPNHPMREGPLLIHMVDDGFAPTLVLESSEGTEVARQEFLVDLDESQPGGLTPVSFGLPTAGGEELSGILTLSLPESDSATGTAILTVSDPEGEVLVTQEAKIGEPIEMPGGEALVLESVERYARLAVADDWSVPWIYALLVLASVGITFAVFSPYRKAWVMLVEDGGRARLHVRTRHYRGSPTFAEQVERAVREVVGVEALAVSDVRDPETEDADDR